ncbi:MAG: alpha-L-fucosidase [Oscillospiraceae bacterium]|jgi:alpha-L-fucosidase|nr:alpha-L-fucosidase [Oscillospiraceae bacterium]
MPKLPPRITEASAVVPSERQLAWQALEFYAFVHFGINTFTGREWGAGDEDPALFQPEKLDCRQWAKVLRAAGMRGMILTCKHHDGFCLWPSRQTQHSVAASPWKNGQGDVVREAAAACREFGLAFGVYLSPWDRHEPSYGKGEAYNAFFKAQLRELCTNYGELFAVWFDGACGEGKSGRKQAYDWQGYYDIVRELQPNAVIASFGPDVRWVGNEAGVCRSSEWSVVPEGLLQSDNGKSNWDLGSRKALRKARGQALVWYPAEVDVSLRQGWFYHEKEVYSVKPLSKLRDIYYKSVGANASLLLNVPPGPDGLLHERDVEVLISLGAQLRIDFKEDLAEGSAITDSCHADSAHTGQKILEPGGYWHSGPLDQPAELVLDLGDDYDIDKIALKEHIATGQQIEKFSLWYDENTGVLGQNKWRLLERGTIIGHKRLIRFNERRVRRFKLRIEACRGFATLEGWEAY